MRLDKSTDADAVDALTAWCGECNAEMGYDEVPGGIGVEYACRGCSAAVFTGDLPLIEAILQPAVA